MSIAGPKPIRRVAHGLPPDWIGFALISTPWSINSASRPGPRNEGSVVLKVVTDRDSLGSAVRGADIKASVNFWGSFTFHLSAKDESQKKAWIISIWWHDDTFRISVPWNYVTCATSWRWPRNSMSVRRPHACICHSPL